MLFGRVSCRRVFNWRGRADRIRLSEYENDSDYQLWEDYKVAYYLLLARVGIIQWVDELPTLSVIENPNKIASIQGQNYLHIPN